VIENGIFDDLVMVFVRCCSCDFGRL